MKHGLTHTHVDARIAFLSLKAEASLKPFFQDAPPTAEGAFLSLKAEASLKQGDDQRALIPRALSSA